MPQVVACPHCSAAVVVISPAPVVRLRCAVCQGEFSPHGQVADVLISPQRREATSSAAVRAPAAVATAPLRLAVEDRAGPASRRRSGGVFGNLVGIVGGGLLGLAAGYYLLNWFGGSQFNLLEIPLPFIAHTQRDAPSAHVESAPRPSPRAAEPAPLAAASPIRRVAVEAPLGPVRGEPVESTAPRDERPSAPPRRLTPGVHGAPRFTAEQLDDALSAATRAAGCPTCDSTGYVRRVVLTGDDFDQQAEKTFVCEDCRGRPPVRLDEPVYELLCGLAETLTFVRLPPGEDASARREALHSLLLRIAADPDRARSLGRLAAARLTDADRPNHGLVLAGTVTAVSVEGPFQLTRIVLLGQPRDIVVVGVGTSALEPQDRVLIAGVVIDRPRELIVGYRGAAEQVVWGGLPLVLSGEAPSP